MLQVEPRGGSPHTGPLFAGHSSKGLTAVVQTGWAILELETSRQGRQWKAENATETPDLVTEQT